MPGLGEAASINSATVADRAERSDTGLLCGRHGLDIVIETVIRVAPGVGNDLTVTIEPSSVAAVNVELPTLHLERTMFDPSVREESSLAAIGALNTTGPHVVNNFNEAGAGQASDRVRAEPPGSINVSPTPIRTATTDPTASSDRCGRPAPPEPTRQNRPTTIRASELTDPPVRPIATRATQILPHARTANHGAGQN